MISQYCRIFSVEYTASGAAIMTADLLGLDARNSAVDPASQSRVSAVNSDLQDLIGLDFGGGGGGTQSLSRQSTVCRPKPAERQHANRAGIVEDVRRPRDAVLLQDTSESDSASVNGASVTASAVDEARHVAEHTAAEDCSRDVVVGRPVPARRAAVRSSSFDGHVSTSTSTTSTPALPVPPPKRNRQRMASNIAALQSQVDELTAQLRSTADERDAALAMLKELEAQLTKYREKYGHID